MSKSVKTVLAFALFATVAACAQQEEPMVVEEPVVVEQPTTKY